MELVSTFKERFAELINGQTYEEVGRVLEIASSTVCAYMKGVREPKRPVLKNIARVYNVSPNWLLGFDVEKYVDKGDEELEQYLDVLRSRPECRMLFSLAKDATKEDVERAVAVIEALKGK